MTERITLNITLRKEVPDYETAKTIYEAIKAKLTDQPDITMAGHVSVRYQED